LIRCDSRPIHVELASYYKIAVKEKEEGFAFQRLEKAWDKKHSKQDGRARKYHGTNLIEL
jgi:hypothetical protein